MISTKFIFHIVLMPFLLFILENTTFAIRNTTYIKINVIKTSTEKLYHFWKSTGLSPPSTQVEEYLLSNDERINIALIGALPNQGIEQIRIHWLINLISFEHGKYNFEKLDVLLDWLHENKLNPGFELMGIPLHVSPGEIENIYQYWFDLVIKLAQRYIERYGFNIVEKWRFETWNEPDLKSYNLFNFTLPDYIKYVTACANGLQAALDNNKSINADPHVIGRSRLKLGGPAGLFKQHDRHPLCWGLLELCNSISDRICPLQYISFHKKGDGSSGQVISKDLELLDIIHSNYTHIRDIPVANDEADILTNWSKDEEWRGDSRYAAMVVKVIIDHFKSIIVERKLKIEVLSNDNGFLNYHPYYFAQRTLFARFQMNNTTPRHVQFVKKPVYTVMGLLSFLGERYIKEEIYSSDPLITVLAARSRNSVKNKSDTFSVLVVYANDTAEDDFQYTKEINIAFENLPRANCKYVIYVLDNRRTNPFLLWKMSSSPVFPNNELLEQMRALQEPSRLEGPAGTSNKSGLTLNLTLTLPSIALIHICRWSSILPGRVTHLQVLNVTRNEALLIWKDNKVNSKCIKTYEIQLQTNCDEIFGPFKRINQNDIVFLSYHYAGLEWGSCDAAQGRYRVRGIDYWNRAGRFSKIIEYPSGDGNEDD